LLGEDVIILAYFYLVDIKKVWEVRSATLLGSQSICRDASNASLFL